MEKDTYHIDLTQGNLIKNLFAFSVPLMLTNCLQMVFNAADTIVVGKFSGSTALAAVGATGSVIFLLGYISKMVNSRNRINEKIIFLHVSNTEEICDLMHSFLD